uniref:MURB-like protein hMURB2 n=1 Tax=Zea mays TaxID=4577 RepID=Q94KN3_MAIZE|nr:MURB-like protein hMURB2 [Zea mays]
MDCPPSKVVADAVEAARAAAVAASEARCAVFVAEKEAKAAVQFAAIAVEKVEAVKASSNLDLVDFKYHVNIKNSLRYAIQEMRRQSKLLHSVQKLCSTIPEVQGGKIGKVRGFLEHVCKELDKTSSICEEDLETKNPTWDLYDNPSVDDEHPLDDDELGDGYSTEDPELWEMVFDDFKWEEIKANVSFEEHYRVINYRFEEINDRNM